MPVPIARTVYYLGQGGLIMDRPTDFRYPDRGVIETTPQLPLPEPSRGLHERRSPQQSGSPPRGIPPGPPPGEPHRPAL